MAKLSVFNKNLLETFTAVGDMNIPGYDAFFGALSQGNAEKLGQSLIAIFQNYRKANETIEDFKAKDDGAYDALMEKYDRRLEEAAKLNSKINELEAALKEANDRPVAQSDNSVVVDAINVEIHGEVVTFTADKIADVVAEKANLEEILSNKSSDVDTLTVTRPHGKMRVTADELQLLFEENDRNIAKIEEQDGRLVTAQRHIEQLSQQKLDLETQLDKVSGDYKVLHDEYVVAGGKKLRPHDPHFDNKRERMNPLYAADVTSQFGKGIKIDPTASMPATPHLEGLKQNTFAQYSLMVFADGEASVLVDALQMSIKHGLTLVIDLTNEPMGNNLHISQLHVNL